MSIFGRIKKSVAQTVAKSLSIDDLGSFMSLMSTAMWSGGGREINLESYKSTVFACVSAIAESVS